jgi:hypothetical protein
MEVTDRSLCTSTIGHLAIGQQITQHQFVGTRNMPRMVIRKALGVGGDNAGAAGAEGQGAPPKAGVAASAAKNASAGASRLATTTTSGSVTAAIGAASMSVSSPISTVPWGAEARWPWSSATALNATIAIAATALTANRVLFSYCVNMTISFLCFASVRLFGRVPMYCWALLVL